MWIKTHRYLVCMKGDHPRIISVKFGDNPPSDLGGDVAQSKLLTDEQWTADNRHRIDKSADSGEIKLNTHTL